MDRSTLVDDIAGLGDGLNDVAGGLAILDLESIRLGGQDAELASNDNDEVGGGSTVLRSVSHWSSFSTSNGTKTYESTLSVRGNVEVVGVQAAGHDDANAWNLVEGKVAAKLCELEFC